MPDAYRVGRVPLVKVGHIPGEELHMGAADADSLDVDDDLAGCRHRGRRLLHLALPGPVRTYARMVRLVIAVIISPPASRSPRLDEPTLLD
jgi:hypothetical protein